MLRKKRIYLLKQVWDIIKADKEIHKNEKEFLLDIAQSMNVQPDEISDIIDLDTIIDLPKPVLSREEKIIQIYQLALMIKADGKITEEEIELIKNIGLEMGLSPDALDIMLEELFKSMERILNFEELFNIFNLSNN